jgi:hypothetical protein
MSLNHLEIGDGVSIKCLGLKQSMEISICQYFCAQSFHQNSNCFARVTFQGNIAIPDIETLYGDDIASIAVETTFFLALLVNQERNCPESFIWYSDSIVRNQSFKAWAFVPQRT